MSFASQALADASYYEEGHEDGTDVLRHAQVHALLALAEQQRLTNLIAYATACPDPESATQRQRDAWREATSLLSEEINA